jgi:hypothetical protein
MEIRFSCSFGAVDEIFWMDFNPIEAGEIGRLQNVYDLAHAHIVNVVFYLISYEEPIRHICMSQLVAYHMEVVIRT